jgi:hypothetical protein
MPRGTVLRPSTPSPSHSLRVDASSASHRASTSRNVRIPATLSQTPVAAPISPHSASTAKTNVLSTHHSLRWRSIWRIRSPVRTTRTPSTLTSAHRWRRWTTHTDGPRHGARRQTHLASIRVNTALEAPRRLATTAATRALAGADFTPRHRTAAAASRRCAAFANGYG